MLPVELQRSVPREVKMTVAGRVVAIIAVALALGAVIAGVALYTAATNDAKRIGEYQRDAAPARATITNIKRTSGKNAARTLTYDYLVDGNAYEGSVRLREREGRNFQTGETIPIYYVRFNPGVSWMASHEPRGVPLWVVPLVSVGMIAGALVIRYSLRRQRALLADGRAAVARVTGVKRVSNGQTSTNRVDYEFTLLSGAKRTGRTDVARNAPAVGSEIVVIYDADSPSRQSSYPLSLYKVDNI